MPRLHFLKIPGHVLQRRSDFFDRSSRVLFWTDGGCEWGDNIRRIDEGLVDEDIEMLWVVSDLRSHFSGYRLRAQVSL